MKKAQEDHLKKAVELALRSGCLRAKTAAVLVKNGKTLAQAHNLIFPEKDFCQKHGCLRDKLELGLGQEAEKCRSIHAEVRAICLAAKKGINLSGATAYLTCQPCINCAKLLYSVGARAVYYLDRHADQTGKVFLEKMGVRCRRVELADDKPEKRLRDLGGQR